MSDKNLLGWLKAGWNRFVDPEREERIQQCAVRLSRWMAEHRRDFSLKLGLVAARVEADDAIDVCERAYSLCVDHAWNDLELTEGEAKSLHWVEMVLQISSESGREIRIRKGTSVFETLLAQAVMDGRIDAEEYRRLEATARWAGKTVRELVQHYFSKVGAGFLRGVFATAVEDGQLLRDEWQNFLESAQRLGFTRSEALELVAPASQEFVEHVLADAKSDAKLSANEERTLKWLLDQFMLTSAFRQYVTSEMQELRLLTDIADGRLPVISGLSGIELKAGELVHFHGNAEYAFERRRRNGIVTQRFTGMLTITDYRAIFTSALKSFILNHGSVIVIAEALGGVEIRTGSNGTGFYDFGDSAKLATAIWRVAVKRANQTIVDKSSRLNDRHIPRDVRQRVWQRYGGRCAVCQSDQYLEFDHIVPIAKGGSNSDKNVQLLCRRCNLRKSDAI